MSKLDKVRAQIVENSFIPQKDGIIYTENGKFSRVIKLSKALEILSEFEYGKKSDPIEVGKKKTTT